MVRTKQPDGPQTPALWQIIQWITRPFAFMETCTRAYGDIFTVSIAQVPGSTVFVSNPQAMQEILSPDTKKFDAPGEENKIFSLLLGDHSVMLVSGDRHRRERQLLVPPFHGERMRTYGQLICNITEQVTNQWTLGKPFSVRSPMQTISLRVILQAVFGLHEGPRYQQLEQLLSSVLDAIGSPIRSSMLFFPVLQQDLGSWSPWGRFVRQRQQIDELIYAEIRDRRQQPDPSRTDILSLLMSAHDEAGESMTDVELRDELMTLLAAGHETTASALTWALYWIHKLPKVREKLLAELDSLGHDSDPSTIARLPYLSAVCSETLRIYPVALITFPRRVKSPLELMGYQFEPGTLLTGCIYLTHQREDLYPEPKRFRPERFLEQQFSPYEYLPFGGSSRRCIGAAFALFEMKLVLAIILREKQLALADNRPAKPVRRGLTSTPSRVRLVVTGQRQKKERSPLAVTSSV
ncbi:MAG: cytochrome P450 [Cyanobacteriota bacterium]